MVVTFRACLPLSLLPAAVQQVRPFGVFVKLDGYRKYGLVHFSQVGGLPGCVAARCRPCPHAWPACRPHMCDSPPRGPVCSIRRCPQISDHLSFSREDPDDVKVKEIGDILSIGDPGRDGGGF